MSETSPTAPLLEEEILASNNEAIIVEREPYSHFDSPDDLPSWGDDPFFELSIKNLFDDETLADQFQEKTAALLDQAVAVRIEQMGINELSAGAEELGEALEEAMTIIENEGKKIEEQAEEIELLQSQNETLKRESIFNNIAEGMNLLAKDKLRSLCEDLSLPNYEQKVRVIKRQHFGGNTMKPAKVYDEPLTETTTPHNREMSAIMKATSTMQGRYK